MWICINLFRFDLWMYFFYTCQFFTIFGAQKKLYKYYSVWQYVCVMTCSIAFSLKIYKSWKYVKRSLYEILNVHLARHSYSMKRVLEYLRGRLYARNLYSYKTLDFGYNELFGEWNNKLYTVYSKYFQSEKALDQ